GDGVVLEIGQGPRGANDHITQLLLNADVKSFTLINTPSGTKLLIPSNEALRWTESADWHHIAFVYDKAACQLRHYVDGVRQPLPKKCALKPLKSGDEDYL